MQQYEKYIYDYNAGKWIILKTKTPITCRVGESVSRCNKCDTLNWDNYLYNYENKIYCDECLIALLRVSE